MRPAVLLLAPLLLAPPAVPDGEARKAAAVWKAEFDKQLPVTKEEVKGLRNATGKRGLEAKAAAEKALRKMGVEPYYVAALREHDGEHDTTGKTASLASASVKVVMEYPGGWVGEIEFVGRGNFAGGFGTFGAGGATITKRLIFLLPFPGKSKVGKTIELTGFFYSPGLRKLRYPNGAESSYQSLVPVEIDPADRPVPPKK